MYRMDFNTMQMHRLGNALEVAIKRQENILKKDKPYMDREAEENLLLQFKDLLRDIEYELRYGRDAEDE